MQEKDPTATKCNVKIACQEPRLDMPSTILWIHSHVRAGRFRWIFEMGSPTKNLYPFSPVMNVKEYSGT